MIVLKRTISTTSHKQLLDLQRVKVTTESATSYQQRVDLQRATSEFTTIIKKGLHLQPITNNLQTIATKK